MTHPTHQGAFLVLALAHLINEPCAVCGEPIGVEQLIDAVPLGEGKGIAYGGGVRVPLGMMRLYWAKVTARNSAKKV